MQDRARGLALRRLAVEPRQQRLAVPLGREAPRELGDLRGGRHRQIDTVYL